MSDHKTTKDAAKKPIPETKVAEAAPKPDVSAKTESKPDTPPRKQGMGEGQKPVSQAYKDNWNAIFAAKKTSEKKR